jgi:hypothetical protein
VAADLVPVIALAAELGKKQDTLRAWAEWDPHPGLGSRLRHDRGGLRNGLRVSRAEATLLVELIQDPYNRPVGNNPGRWIEEGVFVHDDGRRFVTSRFAHQGRPEWGLSENALHLPIYFKRFEAGEVLKVVLPGAIGCSADPWRVTVFAEVAIARLLERRAGRMDGGCWHVPGEEWADGEGRWYSTRYLIRSLSAILGYPITRMRIHRDYVATGILSRYKLVPLAAVVPGGRSGPINVYHESEVDELLRDVRLPPARPVADQAARFNVEVEGAYKKYGCVWVQGIPTPVSRGTHRLLRRLADARAKSEEVHKDDLDATDSNARKNLRQFRDRFPGIETVKFPGEEREGGYRLL